MATTPTTTTTTPSAARRRIARFLLHPRPPAISLSLSRTAAAGCRGHLAGAASKSKGAGAAENKKGQEQE
ncbi:hypothetical protein OsI_05390 [Oryza sativa Indica Group]|uniref:Uncharacterized protein n=2 Tax=Oryza sativa TaxID=4530 RepID=A3BV76_ORYSJ|nr:hypothetical protein OsI_05390 [Oryza sativa Indica Group]EAZ43465.1 hypothetical protein OsJ_28071 [Oryza sativa Japonica Group]